LKYHSLKRLIFGFEYRIFDKKKPIKLDKALVLNTEINNYYHWHFDVILKLLKIDIIAENITKVVLLKPVLKFQIDTVEYFNRKLDFFYSDSLNSIIVEKAYVIEIFNDYSSLETVSRPDLEILKKFTLQFTKQKKAPYKIIYIARNSSLRTLINEKEFINYIKSKGGTAIYLEEYSLKEQYNFVYNAKVIIGIHGAGLTNLIASRESSGVIEITGNKFMSQYYFHLANNLSLEYHQYVSPTNQKNFNSNLYVDLIDFNQKFGHLF
jgi:capsular polysaccharide biosynthesis protein